MREVLCFSFGGLILLANAIDLAWTTLGSHGGGPISGPLTAFVWRIALGIHKRWPHHRALSFVGSGMLVVLLMLWTTLLWLGWFIVFSANAHSVISTETHLPATPAERLYYVAYTISTMGNGDFQASTSTWRVITAFTTLGGLATLTLAITFLLNILPAVVESRQLAVYIMHLGKTPQEMIANSWDGESFDDLREHFIEITGRLLLYVEQHLAYPVLHYYHGEQRRPSPSIALAILHEVCLIIGAGAAPQVRLPPMVLIPLKNALVGLQRVILSEFVDEADEAPPPPSLMILRERNIPTVSDEEFAQAVEEAQKTRRFFKGLVEDDGRRWNDVYHPD